MTDTTAVRLAKEALELAGRATQAPWIWHKYAGESKLVSPPNGRCTVMDFVRKGMQSAQPRFSDRGNAPLGGIMRTADEIGDLYTNPDAAFIARTRTAVPILAQAVLDLSAEVEALKTPVTWKQLDFEDGDTWECSGCKEMTVWEFDPEENMKYCQSCGHPVVFERYVDVADDEGEG